VVTEKKDHPAPYSEAVIEAISPWLTQEGIRRGDIPLRIWDPFGGIGRIHWFHHEHGDRTWAGELEPEWVSHHRRTIVADALHPPVRTDWWHAVVTSPSYGNRFADLYDGRDGSKRRTYRIALDRPLSEGSGAGLQWGDEYRRVHEAAMSAQVPLLVDDGLLIVNMSNHLRTLDRRDGQIEMHVVEWYVACVVGLGLRLVAVQPVKTPRFGFGANSDARAEYEYLIVARKPGKAEMAAAAKVLAFPTQLELW
jgi:hypothetical protein